MRDDVGCSDRKLIVLSVSSLASYLNGVVNDLQAMEGAVIPAVIEESVDTVDIDGDDGFGIDGNAIPVYHYVDTAEQNAPPKEIHPNGIETETDEDGNIIGVIIRDESIIDNIEDLVRVLNLFTLFKKTTTTTTTTTKKMGK